MTEFIEARGRKTRGRRPIRPDIIMLVNAQATHDMSVPRKILAIEVKRSIKDRGLVPPSDNMLIKLISEARARNSKPLPIDKPWSLGTLKDNPLSENALVSVLKAWRFAKETRGKPLTIRESKWIANLYSFYSDIEQLFSECEMISFIDLMSEVKAAKVDWTPFHISLLEAATHEPISPELKDKLLSESSSSSQNYQRKLSKHLIGYLNELSGSQIERTHNKKI
jgi:hypothetical protein